MSDNFEGVLFDWQREKILANAPKPKNPLPPKIYVEPIPLSRKQKLAIIEHVLQVDKGFFEDCYEFWDGMSQKEVDAKYEGLALSVDEFLEECHKLLKYKIGPR